MKDRRRHESNRPRWGVMAGLAGPPILATLMFGLPAGPAEPRPAEAAGNEAAAPAADPTLCSGGAVGEVDVEIRSAEVAGSGADRGLRLSLDVTNHTQDDKEVSYAVEVLGVDGAAKGRATFAAPRLFRRGESARLPPFEAPSGLPDGYYRVLVTTLATGAAGYELTDTREVYIRSRGGVPSVVSHDEWYERSGIQRHGRQG